jgi:succinate dehydrogenase/fumarate reductase flavoprotein subunit
MAKLFEVEHILACADYSAMASLERKESRWGSAHQRTDYPQTDDENWLCHVDLRRGDGPADITVSRRSIDSSLSQ